MRRLLSAAALLLFHFALLHAQTGEISGRVVDDKGEGMPFTNVIAEQDGKLVNGVQTDFDGYYILKLDPGKYDIKVTSMSAATKIIRGVTAYSNKVVALDISTTEKVAELDVVEVKYKKPIVAKDETAIVNSISAEEIAATPSTDIGQIISTTAGVFQADDGEDIHFRGGRADAYEVYIDGIRVIGTYNVPISSIEELTTYTAGIPAKFGDATSGIIEIITKGPAREFGGTVDLSTSQGMDAYGFNRASANLTGPIVTANKGKDDERVALGYFVAGEYQRYQDANPGINGVYTTNDDLLKYLEENPLIPSPSSDAFIPTTETITMDDLEHRKSKPNVVENSYSVSGKLEAKPTKTITISAGGNFIYDTGHSWIDRYTVFNYVNNPYFTNNTWRVYGRFRQRFGGKSASSGDDGDSKPGKASIQNAYYQVQFDFTKVNNKSEDDSHGQNPFDYGYLGKYDILKQPIFQYGEDEVSGKTGWKQIGYQDTLVRFAPGDANPTGTAFPEKYYELAGASFQDGWWTAPYGGAQDGLYSSLTDIQSVGGRGTLNGDRTNLVHGIWYNTGRQLDGYSKNDFRQYSLSVMGSADIVPGRAGGSKHGLEFGFEFEQRVQSNYLIAPVTLWERMRQLANQHIDQLDTDNPYLLIDGEIYRYDEPHPAFGQNDTILYNRKYVASQQSFFDKSVRKKLGLPEDNTDFINIDNYDPDFYSLDMFSADELLGTGQNSFVFYNGYDYLGNLLSSQPSFDDYFKKKDANGNYTRPIGAYRPIYSSAFIQDKFNFKDLLFNVGFRIDRFDANQKVLRDPYTLYSAYTVGEASEFLNAAGNGVPGNIGDDFVVYVDNIENPTKAVGYRDGDTWYTDDGVETSNPRVIADASGGRIAPYLKNPNDDIKSPDFEPGNSFKDYEPQITVMPRIAFSFNITESANFFAHFDILTQRPQGFNQSTPDDWYFFLDRGNFIPNPALKPEKTIDYQVGFKQALTENMAVNLSAYYREFRDMVQVINVPYAYPKDYLTFGNIDFGTVKGFSLGYELRRSETSNFSLDMNYTIQFAEGTGSDASSQQSLVAANQPNLRTIAPLSYDVRNTINLNIDYSYRDGDEYNGPVIKNRQILSNAGINLIAKAWSGTPYTQQENPTPEAETGVNSRRTLIGSINGSRLPWSFKIDLRIWKEFKFGGKKQKTDEEGNPEANNDKFSLNIYLLIRNLLNTENILAVYPYSGNPDDDGYLSSDIGQQTIDSKLYPQSYTDLYGVYIDHPNNYVLPRNIRVGAIFKF